jgi:hypothetical protein
MLLSSIPVVIWQNKETNKQKPIIFTTRKRQSEERKFVLCHTGDSKDEERKGRW